MKVDTFEYKDLKIFHKEKAPNEESCNITFAILKFPHEQEAVKYFLKNKDLKLLSPRHVAQLV